MNFAAFWVSTVSHQTTNILGFPGSVTGGNDNFTAGRTHEPGPTPLPPPRSPRRNEDPRGPR